MNQDFKIIVFDEVPSREYFAKRNSSWEKSSLRMDYESKRRRFETVYNKKLKKLILIELVLSVTSYSEILRTFVKEKVKLKQECDIYSHGLTNKNDKFSSVKKRMTC